ncbi:hypothetical protein SERLA73DRAFT_55949 [Serpula lacrymans var. lacrymans S7.3]|uniref:NADP-dependent oxidoreductase domain-containing protein n=2 Tax=Serpula lacrymans var. lacrymans TaxID=341189 RepID=F8Q0C3_SERL3|nr:uncharacterized protein SERLADRAFT_470928 [Serpula lacrymans var. lacrymans S7.9]EGN98573.1 hypothetical protein SERLA73DRAFT_55949 [Serpula lacrymans var. lacrymans S7.3]EGO24138.1 hypothetical protein SERLADRAFT_470928 [Serpula lacrymans var. lacrymans S7.9]
MHFQSVRLNDGSLLPTIAFGTGSSMKYEDDVTKYVQQAIDVGFCHIDTAAIYKTEENVGIAIRESGLSRSDLYITTKYGGETTIQESFQNSLSKLGIKHVDLYLIHFPEAVKDFEAAWREFEGFKNSRLATSIGVSNFNLEQLQTVYKTASIKPAVNQIEFHPYNYTSHKSLLDFCAQHGIIVEAYSSLTPITKYSGGPVDAPLKAAASRLGITPTQVIFLWVRSKGVVVVTTSRSKDRLQEYLAIEDLAPLTDEEIAAIDKAGANGPPSFFRRRYKTVLSLAAFLLWGLVKLSIVFFIFRRVAG